MWQHHGYVRIAPSPSRERGQLGEVRLPSRRRSGQVQVHRNAHVGDVVPEGVEDWIVEALPAAVQVEVPGLEPEAVQSELSDGAVEGRSLAGRIDEPLVHHGEPPQAVREPAHGLGEISVEPAVDVPGLHHGLVDADEVHLRDHQLRRRGEPGQRRRQVLQAVVDAVHGPGEPAVGVAAEVDLRQVVQGRVVDMRASVRRRTTEPSSARRTGWWCETSICCI